MELIICGTFARISSARVTQVVVVVFKVISASMIPAHFHVNMGNKSEKIPFYLIALKQQVVNTSEPKCGLRSNRILSFHRILAIISVQFCSKMAQISPRCFIIIIVLTILVIFCEENEGKGAHFYSRRSQDLRHLAQTDFELLTQLKSFKGNLAHGQLSSRLLSIVDT